MAHSVLHERSYDIAIAHLGESGETRSTAFVSASDCMSSNVTRRNSALAVPGPTRSIVNRTSWFGIEFEDATGPVRRFLRDGGPSGEAKGVVCVSTEGSDVSRSTASDGVPNAATGPLPREARGESGLGGTLEVLHGVRKAFSSASMGFGIV